MTDRDRVPREKAVAPIVASQSELAASGDGFKLFCLGSKPEVPPTNGHRRGISAVLRGSVCPANVAFAPAVGAINPIVQTPVQSVHAQLLVSLGESGQHDAPLVRYSVTVGVSEKPDVRSRGDKHSFFPRHPNVRG